MINSVLCISIGASAGAVLRWLLGLALNAVFPLVPLGTLAANLLGGYLIGVALGVFAWLPAIGPEWRLLIVPGFLGGLTTFSTFSAEICALIAEERLTAAAIGITLHVGGTFGMTFLGMGTAGLLRAVVRSA